MLEEGGAEMVNPALQAVPTLYPLPGWRRITHHPSKKAALSLLYYTPGADPPRKSNGNSVKFNERARRHAECQQGRKSFQSRILEFLDVLLYFNGEISHLLQRCRHQPGRKE
ncbi:hypothetical protein SKAU_G00348480 [Synaphobranchus kaupii]|uniref:Uncharacterized protein n=1 Tax=Synaphobranchus kaupii TaxID=118154 RepID=A0A9Q1IGZ9_SYNKA|nr:hypothetical protein SKAU_G00348480 [Synaphobranchus kaupii]